MNVFEILIGLSIIVFVIARQLGTSPLEPGKLLLMPLIMLVLAIRHLPASLTFLDWMVLVTLFILGMLAGVLQGSVFQLYKEQNGYWYIKGNWRVLLYWIILLPLRLVIIWLFHLRPDTGHLFTRSITSTVFLSFAGLLAGRALILIWRWRNDNLALTGKALD